MQSEIENGPHGSVCRKTSHKQNSKWDWGKNMITQNLTLGRRSLAKLGLFAALGTTLLPKKTSAAEEMNAQEKANLAIVNAYLRGFFEPKIDAKKMADVFADNCVFRMSDDLPIMRGKETLIGAINKGAEGGKRWDIRIVNALSRGPVVTVSRAETGRAPGKADINIAVVGVFIFKDGKISEWYDYVPKAS